MKKDTQEAKVFKVRGHFLEDIDWSSSQLDRLKEKNFKGIPIGEFDTLDEAVSFAKRELVNANKGSLSFPAVTIGTSISVGCGNVASNQTTIEISVGVNRLRKVVIEADEALEKCFEHSNGLAYGAMEIKSFVEYDSENNSEGD